MSEADALVEKPLFEFRNFATREASSMLDELPTDAVVTVDAPGYRPVMRWPTEPIRPSFLMSRWASSPGCSRRFRHRRME
jgi:hypothetical protein